MEYKRSLKDWQQAATDEHQEEINAKRVVIVGSDMSAVVEGIKASLSEGLKDLKIEFKQEKDEKIVTVIERVEVPVIVKETVIEKVEIPTFYTKVEEKIVEKPVYYTEYKEIQVPVVTQKIETIEKPIIIEKIVEKDYSYLKYILIGQFITLISITILLFIK